MVFETPDNLRQPERRRHQRAKVTLRGRYMLSDRKEYACQTIDISPGGVAILAAIKGAIGERIVAYFDRIGRLEGIIVRHFGRCFAIELSAPALKRERLDLRIAWLVKRQAGLVNDNRRHERVPLYRWRTVLKTPDGKTYPALMIDLSVSGAAISVSVSPPVGCDVTVGQIRASIVRHFRGGVAVVFKEELGEKDFENRGKPGGMSVRLKMPSAHLKAQPESTQRFSPAARARGRRPVPEGDRDSKK